VHAFQMSRGWLAWLERSAAGWLRPRAGRPGTLLLVALCALAGAAHGQEDAGCRARFAGRTLRWIVPSAPGGGFDSYSRLIEPAYERALGVQIVVENHAGAGGVVGAQILRDAAPDGGTLGIVNGPGLLVAALAGQEHAPNPATDFDVLGRVARSQHVWATGAKSDLTSIDDVFAAAAKRPVIFGVREAGGTAFVDIAVASALLGVDRRIVAGFRGNRDASLAAIRGEVDLVAYTFSSIRDRIAAGDLRPLLQISTEPIAADPLLQGVPLLGGPGGVAARRAEQLGRDVAEAVADAGALDAVIGAGRLVIVPRNLEPAVFGCLESALAAALTDPELRAAAAAAHRPLDVARAAAAKAELEVAGARSNRFLPIVRAALEEIRK